MDDELRAILAAQARLIAELSERLAPARKSVPLGEVYARYEASQRHRPGWRTAGNMLRPFVAKFADRDAAGLQVADWTAFRVSRTELAPSSLNYTMRCVKAMLRWAKAEGMLDVAPAICDAKKQKAKKGRETVMDAGGVSAMLGEATEAIGRLVVLCACDAGLRNGEIRRLERSWVDRQRLEIRLPAGITKSRKARTVPITRRLLAAIDAIPRDFRSPLVLVSPRTGGPYSQGHITNVWKALAELAGVQAAPGEVRVRCHDGRHTYATIAAKLGVRIEVLQKILGHSSLDQTRDYVTVTDADLPAARETFEAALDLLPRRR